VCLKIELLIDHPDTIPVLLVWFEQAWEPYYGAHGPGDPLADLQDSCNRDELPVALIALCRSEIYGTAALKAQSVSTHWHLSPWLGALLVDPAYRRQGVGERLVAGVEDRARQLDYERIYAGTNQGQGTAESLLLRRGWAFIENGSCLVSDVAIYKKAL